MTMSILDKKIYFLGDTTEIISDILKKYGIRETDEDLAKKIFGEEPFTIRGGVILKYAISLAKKEINEEEIPAFLKKELNISQIIANGLTSEIKNKLMPIATTEKPTQRKVVIDEPVINIKPPIGIPPIGEMMKKTKEPIFKIDSADIISAPETKKNTMKKTSPTREGEEQKKNKNDKYREET